MSTAAVHTGDPILRAYANLKAIRDNLGTGLVHQQDHYSMFDRALDELQQAGEDVSEWRLSPDAVGITHASVMKARIDAILMYFTFRQEKTVIGFRKKEERQTMRANIQCPKCNKTTLAVELIGAEGNEFSTQCPVCGQVDGARLTRAPIPTRSGTPSVILCVR